MDSFIPSWLILDQRKIFYGVIALSYSLWRVSVGDYEPFKVMVKIFGGFGFMYFASYGVIIGVKELVGKKIDKYHRAILIATAVAYLYILQLIGESIIDF